MRVLYEVIIKLFITLFISLIATPFVKWIACKIGAVDKPNQRRINTKPMPSMGGLAIFIAFVISTLFLFPDLIPKHYIVPILLSATVVLITGILDDLFDLSPRQKLLGIVIAALMIYYYAGIQIDTVPIFGRFDLGIFSMPMTVLWIVALTNAVNLIDGLDGLASGVSIIALMTMGITAYIFAQSSKIYIPLVIFILVASICGFFPYNFHPASIFLGDTGALFIGFMISVMSLQGLKNATFISLITPLVILGVPITDTVYAIIRRLLNKKPISSADKMHLHHRLMSLGFSHRGTVLTIYGLALIFSFISLLYYYTSFWGTIILTIFGLLGVELFVELIGLVGTDKHPLLDLIKKIGSKRHDD